MIKRYNNADSYALAVGLLADRLAGRPDLSRSVADGHRDADAAAGQGSAGRA